MIYILSYFCYPKYEYINYYYQSCWYHYGWTSNKVLAKHIDGNNDNDFYGVIHENIDYLVSHNDYTDVNKHSRATAGPRHPHTSVGAVGTGREAPLTDPGLRRHRLAAADDEPAGLTVGRWPMGRPPGPTIGSIGVLTYGTLGLTFGAIGLTHSALAYGPSKLTTIAWSGGTDGGRGNSGLWLFNERCVCLCVCVRARSCECVRACVRA